MHVTIRLSEVPLHLYQLLAGFAALDAEGALRCTFERLRPGSPYLLPYNMFEVVTDDGLRFIYDMNDGYENLLSDALEMPSFYNGLLNRCNLLFKRSFDRKKNALLCTPEKVRPTPPNFLVTLRGNPAHLPAPCDPRREKIKKLVRMLPASSYANRHVLEENLFSPPKCSPQPRILFMARLWDPAGEFAGQLTSAMAEERRRINDSRADCIRLLRREFGDHFYGGVAASPFTTREYADVVLDDPSLARKDAYLAFMKTFDVHISTMGLHGSTGWKFSEYIAASKAIVCEPLCYESAGGLADGVHYLSFTDADSCVSSVSALLDDRARLEEMMTRNHAYAESYLRCKPYAESTLRDAGVFR